MPMEEVPNRVLHYENVLFRLCSHYTPKQNKVYSRYVFRCRMQQQGTFGSFHTDLKLKARDSNFGAERDKIIRDQIFVGTSDDEGCADTLKVENSTFVQAVKICLANRRNRHGVN